MENPFELINERLQKIEDLLQQLLQQEPPVVEENFSNQLMSVEEVAKYIGLSKPTIYTMKSNKDIPFIKTGKKLLFRRKDIDEWLNKHRYRTKDEIYEEASREFKSKFRKR